MTPELLAEIQKTLAFNYDGTDSLREQQKRHEILDYAKNYGCDTLIETGTNRGDTVEATRLFFDNVYSIEVGPNIYEAAVRRFAGIDNVHLLLGDAREVLPELLKNLPSNNVIFYLDAHCQYDDASPEGKAEGTSVLFEIKAIIDNCHDSVVLIDDARLFSHEYNAKWPELTEFLRSIEVACPWWNIELKDDLIRLTPR